MVGTIVRGWVADHPPQPDQLPGDPRDGGRRHRPGQRGAHGRRALGRDRVQSNVETGDIDLDLEIGIRIRGTATIVITVSFGGPNCGTGWGDARGPAIQLTRHDRYQRRTHRFEPVDLATREFTLVDNELTVPRGQRVRRTGRQRHRRAAERAAPDRAGEPDGAGGGVHRARLPAELAARHGDGPAPRRCGPAPRPSADEQHRGLREVVTAHAGRRGGRRSASSRPTRLRAPRPGIGQGVRSWESPSGSGACGRSRSPPRWWCRWYQRRSHRHGRRTRPSSTGPRVRRACPVVGVPGRHGHARASHRLSGPVRRRGRSERRHVRHEPGPGASSARPLRGPHARAGGGVHLPRPAHGDVPRRRLR
jgi:hypothetical protein